MDAGILMLERNDFMGKQQEDDQQEQNPNQFTCKMFLDTKFYKQLNEQGKEIFECTPEGFCATFPAILEEGVTLGNCVMSFCEVAYIGLNPKYDTENAESVKCELYKPGQEDTTFNVLVTITYKNDKEPHHDLLIFVQKALSDTLYSFQLVGDQTMFAI